jgi:hypothetical protein
MKGVEMSGVGCGNLGRSLQGVPLGAGWLFFVCIRVLFYEILQEFLEEDGYLGKDGLELCC